MAEKNDSEKRIPLEWLRSQFKVGLFWDTDKALDVELDYVVNRIVDKGYLMDIGKLINIFGRTRVRDILRDRNDAIQELKLYFMIAILEDKKENYRCFRLKKFLPE